MRDETPEPTCTPTPAPSTQPPATTPPAETTAPPATTPIPTQRTTTKTVTVPTEAPPMTELPITPAGGDAALWAFWIGLAVVAIGTALRIWIARRRERSS